MADNSIHTDGFTTMGFAELQDDLMDMAVRLSGELGGNYAKTVESILNEAAQPVLDAALRFAPVRSGRLRGAIALGKVIKRKNGSGYSIKIGVNKDQTANAPHAHLVEFGHGGPKPAPPHPFMQPAYDTTKEQAYAIIRRRLNEELDKTKNK
jgi:HK97 gp10 family phage protein